MHRVLVGESEVLGRKSAYYLLVDTAESIGHYGVEIVWGIERSAVYDLAVSGGRVLQFAQQLLRCAVTPMALRDVADDWLLC